MLDLVRNVVFDKRALLILTREQAGYRSVVHSQVSALLLERECTIQVEPPVGAPAAGREHAWSVKKKFERFIFCAQWRLAPFLAHRRLHQFGFVFRRCLPRDVTTERIRELRQVVRDGRAGSRYQVGLRITTHLRLRYTTNSHRQSTDAEGRGKLAAPARRGNNRVRSSPNPLAAGSLTIGAWCARCAVRAPARFRRQRASASESSFMDAQHTSSAIQNLKYYVDGVASGWTLKGNQHFTEATYDAALANQWR